MFSFSVFKPKESHLKTLKAVIRIIKCRVGEADSEASDEKSPTIQSAQ